MRLMLAIVLAVASVSTSTVVFGHGTNKSMSSQPQTDVQGAPAIPAPFQQATPGPQNGSSPDQQSSGPSAASVCAIQNVGACQVPPSTIPVGVKCFCDTPTGRFFGVSQ
ncbi:hypothetical protein SBC1_41310 (plasmid) [Caballeronia sp. SBC1]|nr:hypothetical protein SBC2_46630 [Caballeronia sp. SBC2]QIN64091.1 hypothetical protein SBC1_41310 [Caballeronia sp. SBC1]